MYVVYCETRVLACSLFREFHDLGDVAKITGREYLKSHAISVYYLVQQAKKPK